jgi:hypothetical protein
MTLQDAAIDSSRSINERTIAGLMWEGFTDDYILNRAESDLGITAGEAIEYFNDLTEEFPPGSGCA